MDQALLAEYAYLDDLDCRGWAWEVLRRNDKYRADYDRLQTLEGPEPFESEHAALANNWHVRRLFDPDSREIPEFFHERYQNVNNLMWRDPHKWEALVIEMTPPRFNPVTWKHSIICKDLKVQGCSYNEIARDFYPGYKGKSHVTQHGPARDRVRDDLKRLRKLQAEYLKIAFYQ